MTLKTNTYSFATPEVAETVRLEESGSYTFVGYAVAGATETQDVWKIIRMYESGSSLVVVYADGNQLYDNIWSNRLSLTYL